MTSREDLLKTIKLPMGFKNNMNRITSKLPKANYDRLTRNSSVPSIGHSTKGSEPCSPGVKKSPLGANLNLRMSHDNGGLVEIEEKNPLQTDKRPVRIR